MTDVVATRPWLPSATYLTLGVLAIVAYCSIGGAGVAHAITYDLLVVSGGMAIVLAVHHHRPPGALGWNLIAVSLFLLAAGDVTWDVYEQVWHREVPLVSAADAFYLASYPFLVVGVAVLVRRRRGRDFEGTLDGIVAALASLVILIEPLVRNRSGDSGSLAIAALYVLADVAIIGAFSQLVVVRLRRPAVALLAVSLVTQLMGDIAFVWLGESYEVSTWLDATWLLHAVTAGAAAMHPSVRFVAEPMTTPPQRLTQRRLLLACAALVVLPVDVVINGDVNGVIGALRLSARIGLLVLVAIRLLRLASTNARVEARLSSVLTSSGDPIVYGNAIGEVEQSNPAAAELFGEDVAVRSAHFVDDDTLRALHDQPHVDVVKTGQRRDGSQYFVTARVSAMRDADAGWVAVARDTTADLATKLLVSTVRGDDSLASTLDNVVTLTQTVLRFSSAHVFEVDASGAVAHLAGSATDVHAGIDVTQAIVAGFTDGPVTFVAAPSGTHALIPVFEQDGSLSLVVVIGFASDHQPSTGTRAVLSDLASAIGQTLRTAVAFARERDVARRLQEVERLKGDFLRMIGHELRAPIAAIKAGAEVLATRNGDATTSALAPTLVEGAQGLDRLVSDLVAAARGDAGDFPCRLHRVADPTELIERAATSLDATGRVRTNIGALPPVMVDEDRLRQLLANLVGNALKFSHADAPVVVTACAAGDEVHVSVTDRGPGIRAEDLPMLFQRFSRLPRRDGAAATEGTGLGLFISRGIATAHGGRLWAESDGATGSTFHLTLPAAAHA